MATGYTYRIQEGDMTFHQYAISVAGAFGALVEYRDAPLTALPEELPFDNWRDVQLEECKMELQAFKAKTDAEIAAQLLAEYAEAVQSRVQRLEHTKQLRARYEDMLAKVKKWQAPSPDHKEYKQFMINQLVESIAHDCNIREQDDPILDRVERYKHEQLGYLTRAVTRAAEYASEARLAHQKKQQWITQLRESLLAYNE